LIQINPSKRYPQAAWRFGYTCACWNHAQWIIGSQSGALSPCSHLDAIPNLAIRSNGGVNSCWLE